MIAQDGEMDVQVVVEFVVLMIHRGGIILEMGYDASRGSKF